MRFHHLVVVSICIIGTVLFGCSRHRSVAVTPQARPAKNPYSSSSPADLSEYIRTVLKISEANTEAADQVLAQLHQRRPDLVELSARVAANARDLESRHVLAAAYMEEGLYHRAFQLYREIRALTPYDPAVELAIARIWFEWGDYSLAHRYCEQAVALDSRLVQGLELLGRIHLRRNEPETAVSTFMAALKLSPENASLHTNVGYAFLTMGDWSQARAYLERAVELDESLTEARNNLGVVLAHLGDRDSALREFLAVNEPAPAFNNLGVVYLSQKRWGDAREAFRRALALDPGYDKARTNLFEAESHIPPPSVISLPSLGWEQSRAQGVSGMSKDQASRRSRAKQGRTSKKGVTSPPAPGRMEQASRLSVAYEDALNRFNSSRYQDAIAVFQWLLRQYPNSRLASNCQYWIGESYFGLGNYRQALVAFKRVMSWNGSSKKRDAQLMMKRTYARLAQREKARGV